MTPTPRGLRQRIATGAITAVALLAASGISVATGGAAHATTRLGGVDMQRACTTQWPGYGLTAHVNNPTDAYSWRCWAPWDHSSYGIDVNRECVTQYGGGAYAGLGNTRDPYSWYCQR
jgi:hypothetical protein